MFPDENCTHCRVFRTTLKDNPKTVYLLFSGKVSQFSYTTLSFTKRRNSAHMRRASHLGYGVIYLTAARFHESDSLRGKTGFLELFRLANRNLPFHRVSVHYAKSAFSISRKSHNIPIIHEFHCICKHFIRKLH